MLICFFNCNKNDFFSLSLFSLVDPRYVCYLPSVFAAATMLHVIHQMELCNPLHYENQLLGVLNISEVVFLPLSYRLFFYFV